MGGAWGFEWRGSVRQETAGTLVSKLDIQNLDSQRVDSVDNLLA